MGRMNLLRGNWIGKVGQTVGAKWKNKSTIRTYSIPTDPKTQAQQTVRTGFKDLSHFVALFSDGIKYLTALDTSGMSVRNAIMKLNKGMVAGGTFEKANLAISKGGLQKPAAFTPTMSSQKIACSWTAPTATNFSPDAKIVIVAVQPVANMVEVKTFAASAGTGSLDTTFATVENADVYAYYIDKRGSVKIGSPSVYVDCANA